MKSLHNLVQSWNGENVQAIAPGATDEIRRVFAELGSVATLDVITMYQTIGGMNAMDDEYWRLWLLAEVVAENQTGSSFGVLFSDYLLSSWAYRLKPKTDMESEV